MSIYCGACKKEVYDWEEHIKTDEHKKMIGAFLPLIDDKYIDGASKRGEVYSGSQHKKPKKKKDKDE